MKRMFYGCEDAKMQNNREQETGNGEQILIIPFTVYRLPFTLLLFTLYSLLFTSLAFAGDSSNWGVQQPSVTKPTPSEISEKVWDKENNEKVYEDYGSKDSPGFLNREDVDPATTDFEEKYDYEDDEPYTGEVN
jgi:hypothetical protein